MNDTYSTGHNSDRPMNWQLNRSQPNSQTLPVPRSLAQFMDEENENLNSINSVAG